MLVQGKRPRELRWRHAGAMLFGDWGTSRLYVLGLCFFYTGHASLWFMAAMSVLLLGVGWAYQIICRLYPDGGGVYSSARRRSHLLGMIGGLLLCADYVVTAALSALDAFHYVELPYPALWAAGSMLAIGVLNYFGPRKSGTVAVVIALLTVAATLVIAVAALPYLGNVRVERPQGSPISWWAQFTYIILAISGVEAVANMTGIMVEPVKKTSRRAILPVMIEIVVLNLLITLAMQAVPLDVLGGGDPTLATEAHRDDMLRLLAEYYVGPAFAVGASLVFALLLLSAANTAITDLVSIQFMMSRDRELPAAFGGLNKFGMPALALAVAVIVPLVVVVAVADVGHLADLYAIGVVGAVAVNLGSCSTDFSLPIRRWERAGMMGLAVLMTAIWVTIAWEKPWALAFAVAVMVVGLAGRWVARNFGSFSRWIGTTAASAVASESEVGEPTPAEEALYAPSCRVMVATRGSEKLLRFAIEEASVRKGILYVVALRQVAVAAMGADYLFQIDSDPEAQAFLKNAERLSRQAGVPVQLIYAVAGDVGEAILDLAVTHSADYLILGATRRGALWRTMKGDVLQRVARYLPDRTSLLIHA